MLPVARRVLPVAIQPGGRVPPPVPLGDLLRPLEHLWQDPVHRRFFIGAVVVAVLSQLWVAVIGQSEATEEKNVLLFWVVVGAFLMNSIQRRRNAQPLALPPDPRIRRTRFHANTAGG